MPARRSPARSLAAYREKRDFSRTREPAGGGASAQSDRLRFVIQKHAASHLHFDLRLELSGVMKSWAVPKGPSVDPSVRRLAMQVEDHPVEYNTFEGTIPQGEYGGGTVMLWDRGWYEPNDASPGEDAETAVARGYRKGKLDITFHGERMHGSWALVRMRPRGPAGDADKPQWLLIKHRDAHASAERDIAEEVATSVATGHTMEEIAAAPGRVWHAKDAQTTTRAEPRMTRTNTGATERELRRQTLAPMMARIGTAVPDGEGWTFEPKYDGIRVLAYVTTTSAALITRNGKDKAAQFPEVTKALRRLASKAKRPLVLDGEIVALVDGAPARFQELQQRMGVKDPHAIATLERRMPAALMVFDLLVDGDDVLVREPWTTRRARLEQRMRRRTSPHLRVGETVPGDGGAMLRAARNAGWEGIIAKRTQARYEPGGRSGAWLKLKVQYQQEFVVGGYTEPRRSRPYLGALLLGYYDADRLIYVGHTGGGFTRAQLHDMYERLRKLERKTSPFAESPKTNERPHWVRPQVVVEVKFNEWTADGKLRQPIFLGVRDDKDPHDVGLEAHSVQEVASTAARGSVRKRPRATAAATTSGHTRRARADTAAEALGVQLDAIEHRGGGGTLQVARGQELHVTNLDKVFFPHEGITKGDLMRYYVQMATSVLPVMRDRPLVLKRFPDGIDGEAFFQQKAPDHVPDEVRVEAVHGDGGATQERIVGGDLATLLYTVQLGSISVDPWHSRVQSLDQADYTILDLDPGPRAPFRRVVEVALMVRAEMDELGLRGAIKTSGATGLHIVLPMPARTSYETALLVAQIVATRVATAHPKEATVVRAVGDRLPAAVYVDYLQNVRGKTVAAAYCVRAHPGATVSTPLDWNEVVPELDPRSFTVRTMPARLAMTGDLWTRAIRRRNTASALRAVAEAPPTS